EALLDVRHAHLEHEVQPGQTRVVATDRPRSRLQAARIVGEDQLLQGEGEGVAGGEPPGALRLYARDQVRPHIKECVAGSAAQPLETDTDERVSVKGCHVAR